MIRYFVLDSLELTNVGSRFVYGHLTRSGGVQSFRVSSVHEIGAVFSNGLTARGQRCADKLKYYRDFEKKKKIFFSTRYFFFFFDRRRACFERNDVT